MRARRPRLAGIAIAGAMLLPVAMLIGLISPVLAAPITIVDDGGADDNVGQKDLNSFTFDYDNQANGTIDVSWNWDDTFWSGGNTGDACALFDTDDDGFINNAVCVGVGGAGVETYTTTYRCSDKDNDRCTAPHEEITTSSVFTTSVVADSDPFGDPNSPDYDPTHASSANVCQANPDCNTDDTVADGTIELSDFDATTAELINVCSYESASPNSNPEECVINPDLPTLTIFKVCVPTTDTGLFNLRLDGVTEKADAACGTDTGAITTSIGSHTVSETAGTGTNLSDYTSTISGDCAADGSITLAEGEDKSCTITNSRLPRLTIYKVCVPTSDTGTFDLKLDGVTKADDTACGTNTGAITTTIGGHTVSEAAGTGTDLADYTSAISGDCASDGTIALAAGDNKSCTITNSRLPRITIYKVCVPTTDTGTFDLKLDGVTKADDTACGTNTGAIVTTIGGHTVSEAAGTGTNLDDYTSAISGDCASDGTITLAAGDNKSCTITNTKKGEVEVVKTVDGAPPSGTDQFVFTLRSGASSSSKGTVLATGTATAGNGGTFTFNVKVAPGTYQLCEAVQAGFGSSLLSDPSHFILDQATSEDDNEWVCIPITVTAGNKTTVNVNNTRPPGGMAKTIGFWKSHATCAGNNANSARPNATALNDTLGALGSVLVGDLTVDTCQEAVSILNKSTLSGRKQASNPLYNFAAQYLAYKLNLQAGAGDCGAAATAAAAGQALLDSYNFNGVSTPKPNKTDSALLNSYEKVLDDYNNNTLSGC